MQIDTLKRIFKTFWWRFFCFRSESVCVLFRNQHTLKSSFRFPVPLMNRTVQCAGWENLEHVINKWFTPPLEHSRFVAEVKSWPWIIFFCFFFVQTVVRELQEAKVKTVWNRAGMCAAFTGVISRHARLCVLSRSSQRRWLEGLAGRTNAVCFR